jgi:hypothetical protein
LSALIFGVKLKIAKRKFKVASGFSLTEVLMAAGILSIGFMLIATLFPAGMMMTTTATERTIASVVTDEAFAKTRLFGIADFDDPCAAVYWPADPNIECVDWNYVSKFAFGADNNLYPSIDDLPDAEKRYSWSALCRSIGTAKDFQITVFVSRKAAAGAKFPSPMKPMDTAFDIDYPKPIRITRVVTSSPPGFFTNEIDIVPAETTLAKCVVAGSIIIDNKTGLRMTVLTREQADSVTDYDRRRLILADAVEEASLGNSFWVIPPARNGGKSPCIGIYQRVIGF